MQIPALFLLRRAAVLGLAALALTACSKTDASEHNAPPSPAKVADAPEPQNLQEKAIDFSARPSGLNGGMKSLDAQRDIPQLLNQIHNEAESKK